MLEVYTDTSEQSPYTLAWSKIIWHQKYKLLRTHLLLLSTTFTFPSCSLDWLLVTQVRLCDGFGGGFGFFEGTIVGVVSGVPELYNKHKKKHFWKNLPKHWNVWWVKSIDVCGAGAGHVREIIAQIGKRPFTVRVTWLGWHVLRI